MPRRSSRKSFGKSGNVSPGTANKPGSTDANSGSSIKRFFQSVLGWNNEKPAITEEKLINKTEVSDLSTEDSDEGGNVKEDLQSDGQMEVDTPTVPNVDKHHTGSKKKQTSEMTSVKPEIKNQDEESENNNVKLTSPVETATPSEGSQGFTVGTPTASDKHHTVSKKKQTSEMTSEGSQGSTNKQDDTNEDIRSTNSESAHETEINSGEQSSDGKCVPNHINADGDLTNEDTSDMVGLAIEGEDSSEVLANKLADPNGLLTNEMIEEERLLREKSEKEEEKIKEQRNKLMKEMTEGLKEDRFRRLQFLLNKSNSYTEYLIKRMESQKEEARKRKERKEKIALRKAKKEEEKALREKDDKHENKTEVASVKMETRRRVKGSAPDSQDNSQDSPNSTSAKKGKKRILSKSAENNADEQASKKQKISEEKSLDKENITDNTSLSPVKKEDVNAQGDAPSLDSSAEDEVDVLDDDRFYLEAQQMINGEAVPPEQPVLFSGGVLRSYQIDGYKWMNVLYENGVNGILADEMGLGKTVQCIATIAHLTLMEVGGPYLIVGPLSTLPNWYSEFQRFTPKLPVILYHGSKEDRNLLRNKILRKTTLSPRVKSQPIVITSYEIAMIDRKHLHNYEWKYLIVDEGHRLKNTNCRLIHELKMYHTTHRLLLTGTPLQNNLSELWSLLNFLLPEIFDDLGSFEAWFDVELITSEGSDEKLVADQQRQDVLSMLHQILTPFLLRRLKSDVDLCIPPKREVLVYAPMTVGQEEYYSAVVSRTVLQMIQKKKVIEEKIELLPGGRPVRHATKKKVNYEIFMEDKSGEDETPEKKGQSKEDGEEELDDWIKAVLDNQAQKAEKEKKVTAYSSQVTIKMANIMMQLRKCCNHPYLLEYPLEDNGDYKIDEGVVKASGKMMLFDRMLMELKRRGHKVLLFSQMTKMLDIIEDYCYLKKIKYCRLDGSCKVDDRREQIDTFNKNPEMFLFLLSTRAGGLGLNLVAADTVIIYDSDWNPQCDLQAQDRCHRIGQKRPVLVYRLVTASTIDQRIVERAAAKRKLEKIIIHKGKFKSGIKDFSTRVVPMTPEELLALLNSKDHQGIVGAEGEVISDDGLQKLLDRSDLEVIWKKQQQRFKNEQSGIAKTEEDSPEKSTKTPQEVCSLFKVIDTVDGRIGLEKK